MHATYGWTAAGKLPCSQDIRPTSPRIGTIPQCVPPLGRLAQRCLLLALGSGEVDVAFGVALEKTFGLVRFYFNTGLTIPTGNPFSGSGIDSLPMLSTFLTGEYRLTERFSLLVQLNGVTSPVRNTGFDIDRPTFEILAGFNWALPGLPEIWQAGFMEDLNDTNRTADFALFMSWSIFFGHRASTPR
jgi:hypothetical protein